MWAGGRGRGPDATGGPPRRSRGRSRGRARRRGGGGVHVCRVVSVDRPGRYGTTPCLAGCCGDRPTAANGAVVARCGLGGAVRFGGQPFGSLRGPAHPASQLASHGQKTVMTTRSDSSGPAPFGTPMRAHDTESEFKHASTNDT